MWGFYVSESDLPHLAYFPILSIHLKISWFRFSNSIVDVWLYFHNLLVEGYLVFSHYRNTLNTEGMNMAEQESVKWDRDVHLGTCQGLIELSHMIDAFLVVRELPTLLSIVSASFCTSFITVNEGSISPYPHQHLLLAVFLILAILSELR